MKMNCSNARVSFKVDFVSEQGHRTTRKNLSLLPSTITKKKLFFELDPSQTEATRLLPSSQVIADSFPLRIFLSPSSPLVPATTSVRLAKF